MAEARFVVRGLDDEEAAEKVEATLFSKVGVQDVKADQASGELWIRYDERMVPQPRLRSYLQSAGVSVIRPVV